MNIALNQRIVAFFLFFIFFVPSWALEETQQTIPEGIPQITLEGSEVRRFQSPRHIFSNQYSIIHSCYDAKRKEVVVVKYAKPKAYFENEVAIFQRTAFLPHVIGFFEPITEGEKTYLVMEYANGGDLFDYIKRSAKNKAVINVRKIFVQIMRGVAELHGQRVAHLDIKTENIFFLDREKPRIKLGDLGLALYLPPENKTAMHCRGSLNNIAPEIYQIRKLNEKIRRLIKQKAPAKDIFKKQKALEKICHTDPFKADIYSAAIVLYNLISDSSPYSKPSKQDPLFFYMRAQGIHRLVWARKHEHLFEKGALDLLDRMMNMDPNKRPTALEVLKDPWLCAKKHKI